MSLRHRNSTAFGTTSLAVYRGQDTDQLHKAAKCLEGVRYILMDLQREDKSYTDAEILQDARQELQRHGFGKP